MNELFERELQNTSINGVTLADYVKENYVPSRKKGQWSIDVARNDPDRKWDWRRFYCSVCGGWQTYGQTKYCPKCGAEMEVSDEL